MSAKMEAKANFEVTSARKASHLPEDLIFDILVRLPAETVHKLRYVCKSWFNIITSSYFIDAHLQVSKPGILLIKWKESISLLFFSQLFKSKDERNTLREFNAGFSNIWSSCNGLVLFGSCVFPRDTFVANPVTNDGMRLPAPLHGTDSSYRHILGMAYIAFTREYRVIHCFLGKTNGCQILTLGHSTWKSIHMSVTRLKRWRGFGKIIFIDYVAHWMALEDYQYCVVSLDMIEEKFFKAELPSHGELFEVEGVLSLVHHVCEHDSRFEIWALRDLRKGEWVLKQKVELAGVDGSVYATASIDNGRGIIFRQYDSESGCYNYIVYDVQLKQIRYLDYNDRKMCHQPMSHIESLVSCSDLNNKLKG